MDSYFTNVFAESFVPYIKTKGPNKKIVELLEDAGLDVKAALEIMVMERPFRRIRTLIENHLDNHVTQRSGTIDKLFLAFNLANFSENIQKLKKRSTLFSVIENAVKRRHQIVHEGDLNSRKKLNQITTRDVKRKLRYITLFVSGADEILQRSLN